MSLKRHPALQPFSRDHLIGLFHAQKLIKTERGEAELSAVIEAFANAWQREISVHFADEDRLLGHLEIKEEGLKRLDREHVELTALIMQLFNEPTSKRLAVSIGKLLDAHIRWEEHELFPEIESTLSPSELQVLEQETLKIEQTRNRSL